MKKTAPNVYAYKMGDGLYEYGVIRTEWVTTRQFGNLWLNGFQYWEGYSTTTGYERRGYAPTMTIAQQLMKELTP